MSDDIFAKFGIERTTDRSVVELAIERKVAELRRSIARGEVDPLKATVNLNRQKQQLRLAADLPPLTPVSQPTVTAPARAPAPAPAETDSPKAAEVQPAKTGTCRTCGGMVSLKAQTCPHCGEKSPARSASSAGGNIVGMFFLIVGGLIAFLVIAGSIPNSSTRSDLANNFYLHSLCEDAVRSKLKAPSTAIFARGESTSYSASGTVDSQNSFGAMLRSSYRCSFSGDVVTAVSVY